MFALFLFLLFTEGLRLPFMVQLWGSENNSQGSVLSYHMSPPGWTRVLRLGSIRQHLLNHLDGPEILHFSVIGLSAFENSTLKIL